MTSNHRVNVFLANDLIVVNIHVSDTGSILAAAWLCQFPYRTSRCARTGSELGLLGNGQTNITSFL